MTITRKLTAATAVLAIAGTGVAAAADAPIVSTQKTSPTKTAPAQIPGTGLDKGERLPRGARIVYRDVTLEGRQTARLTLTAPSGKRIRALVPRDRSNVGFVVTTRGSYAGKKKVALRAFASPKASGEVKGRIYGLAR